MLFCATFLRAEPCDAGTRAITRVPEHSLPTPRGQRFHEFVFYWLPVLLYLTIILVLSSQPNLQPPLHFRNSDKYWHALEYMGLGLLLARALRSSLRVRESLLAAGIALALCVVVATGDEFYQRLIPGRDSSVYDLLADTAGAAIAQFLFIWFARD